MTNLTLEQRIHKLIYDADPEIPAAAVIVLVRAANEIRAMDIGLIEPTYAETVAALRAVVAEVTP